MKDFQESYKTVVGVIIVIASILFGIWLCLRVMLYGGITQAIENWGTDNSAVVWGIIKAIFFEVGMVPAYFGVLLGLHMTE